jgi:hypothetical protein
MYWVAEVSDLIMVRIAGSTGEMGAFLRNEETIHRFFLGV